MNIAGPLEAGMERMHLLGQALIQRPQRLQVDRKSASSKAPGGLRGLASAERASKGLIAPAAASAVPDRKISRRVK